MGGVVVLLAGDFRETLPVIPKGTMADELKACLKASYLWKHVIKLELKTNMRVHLQGDVSAGHFAQQLLTIGNGKVPAEPTSRLISIPDNFCNVVESIEVLKSKNKIVAYLKYQSSLSSPPPIIQSPTTLIYRETEQSSNLSNDHYQQQQNRNRYYLTITH
ncbi:unnamed protein product [Rotaria sp. Silwood2]|nr:unnamed protein product [Rotaria sp. Silwood2]CAF2520092.1 unnamed protein product [Rotaria sp. Silwood2]CAF4277511.1 unnamed protein product [Rotaria sp. Silwood2]CAF4497350.1 unnamed protein product [Rotaria sp. Silwood2]